MKSSDDKIIHLIKGCKENDRLSQKKMYDIYYSKMMGVALRYFNDKDIASDLVQESFIKAFSKIEQFKFGNNFEGWIKRIVVNQSLDLLRKNKKIKFLREDSLVNVSQKESAPSPEYEKLNINDILSAVNDLSQGYKIIFNLYVFEGLTHKKIAEKLNISEGTSKSNYAKAKSNLKSILSKIHNIE